MPTRLETLQRIPNVCHFTDVANLPRIERLEGFLAAARMR